MDAIQKKDNVPSWTNLTPHAVNILRPVTNDDPDDVPIVCKDRMGVSYVSVRSFPQSGQILRASERRSKDIIWSFTCADIFGDVTEVPSLPPAEFIGMELEAASSGVVEPVSVSDASHMHHCIVSMIVAPLLVKAGAQFVAVPDTSPESAVRDENGIIKGVRGMVCYPPKRPNMACRMTRI